MLRSGVEIAISVQPAETTMNLVIISAALLVAFTRPTFAAPLTCEAFGSRLWVRTQVDTSLSDKSRFTAVDGSLNEVTQKILVGYGADDIRIYCGPRDQLRMITLTYETLDLNRPSVFTTAKALIADITCTLMRAPMEDCDGLTSQMFKTAVSSYASGGKSSAAGYAQISLAHESWRMTLSVDRATTGLDFIAGDGSTLDQAPMHLGH